MTEKAKARRLARIKRLWSELTDAPTLSEQARKVVSK